MKSNKIKWICYVSHTVTNIYEVYKICKKKEKQQ